MARSTSSAGPTWGQIFALASFCLTVICALIAVIYWNMHDDIRDLKTAANTAVQSISDIRVDVASMKSDVTNIKQNVSQILQRMPVKN